MPGRWESSSEIRISRINDPGDVNRVWTVEGSEAVGGAADGSGFAGKHFHIGAVVDNHAVFPLDEEADDVAVDCSHFANASAAFCSRQA